jgi:hypothetical protein
LLSLCNVISIVGLACNNTYIYTYIYISAVNKHRDEIYIGLVWKTRLYFLFRIVTHTRENNDSVRIDVFILVNPIIQTDD